MYLSHGPPSVHTRPGILKPNESFQAVACNPSNDVVVAVSQLQVHFWASAPLGGLVYLSSLDVPGTSLDEDPAVHALWHPLQSSYLAVVTSRRVVYIEADLHPPRQGFLGLGNSKTLLGKGEACNGPAMFCDVQSRVCVNEDLLLDSGIVTSVSPAGPYAFLVSTTAGAVYVVGWNRPKVLHTFTVASLRAPCHHFTIHGKGERETSQPGSASYVDPAVATASATTDTVAAEKDEDDSGSDYDLRQQQQHIHHRVLTGAILHATFNPKLQLFSMVISSGYLLLARPSCGFNFAQGDANLTGCFVPAAAACSTSINGTHMLLAVATHSGSLSCYRLQPQQQPREEEHLSITPASPLWRCNGTHKGDGTWVRNHGPISALEWCPGKEEVLSVGLYRVGVMLLHYSGACVLSSFSTDSSTGSAKMLAQHRAATGVVDASVNAQVTHSSLRGCLSVQWCRSSWGVVVVEPQSSQLVCFRVARAMSPHEVGPFTGVYTPLSFLDSDGIFLSDYAGPSRADSQTSFVEAPPNHTPDTLPLRYGCVSPNGNRIAVAGRKGLFVYSRSSCQWQGFVQPQEESKCTCLCDPAWLSESIVAAAVMQDRSKFFVAVFLYSDMHWTKPLAKQPLEARPMNLSVTIRPARGDGFMVVQDVNSRIHVLRFNIFWDSSSHGSGSVAPSERVRVVFTPLRCVDLDDPAVLVRPLRVWPVCTSAAGVREDYTGSALDDVPCLVIHLQDSHSLVLLNPIGDDPFTARAKQFQTIKLSTRVGYRLTAITPPGAAAYNCWVDSFSPLGGVNLAVYEDKGFFYYHLSNPRGNTNGTGSTAAVRGSGVGGDGGLPLQRKELQLVDRLCITSRETDIIPLCLSPYDGFAIGVCEGREVTSRAPATAAQQCGAFDNQSIFLRPVLYAPRVLGLMLQKAMPTILQQPSESPQAQPPSASLAPAPAAAAAATRGALRLPGSFAGPGSAVSAQVKRTKAEAAAEGCGALSPSSGGRLTVAFTWDDRLFHWLQSMRENGSFVMTFDNFLMSILDDNPPGGIAQLDRKSGVRAVVGLLRNYPEFYEIMVGCVRKIDMSRWQVLLDFLGSPLDLYQECIDNGRFTEAVHLVRVIMMTGYGAEQSAAAAAAAAKTETLVTSHGASNDTGAIVQQQQQQQQQSAQQQTPPQQPSRRETLQQACECAIKLFEHTIRNGDFSSAYDLLRFTALVRHEMGMPAAIEVVSAADRAADNASGGNGVGTSSSALGRWLRTLVGVRSQERAVTAGAASRTSLIPVKGFPSLFFVPKHVATTDPDEEHGEPEDGAQHAATEDGRAPSNLPRPSRRRGPKDMDAAEELQRRQATQMMFATYPELPAMVEKELSQLLAHGHLLRLCRLLETFSLSLDGFLREQCKPTPEAVTTEQVGKKVKSLRLSSIFDGIHLELALPRSGRAMGDMGSQALCQPGSPIEKQMSAWSQAQVALYGNRRIMDTLNTLRALFEGHHVYFDLAFALIRMSSADVIAILTSGVGAEARKETGVSPDEWPTDRVTRCVSLLSDVSMLVRLPVNRGYAAFVDSVVAALPPTMLKASGYVSRTPPPPPPELTESQTAVTASATGTPQLSRGPLPETETAQSAAVAGELPPHRDAVPPSTAGAASSTEPAVVQ